MAALRDGPPSAGLVDGLLGRCAILRNTAGLEDAAADARAALGLARQMSYATGEAMALAELSFISSYAGDTDQALQWARQAQRIDRGQMPGWHARWVEQGLPYVMVMGGRLDGALELCEQALAQARTADDLGDQADTLCCLADLARQAGQLTDAQVHLRETVDLAMRASYRLRLIDAVEVAGHLCAADGQHAAAVTLWAARDAQAAAAGLTVNTWQEIRRREQPWQQAAQALDAAQVRAAQERGAAMTLAAAAEFAIMTGAVRPGQAAPARPGKLSGRERELVVLVARGQTDAEMAKQLFISVSTVRTHLDRIRDKSGCRRRADLTRLALQEGII